MSWQRESERGRQHRELRHLLRYIMIMLWGRNWIRYGGQVCSDGVSICPLGLVGWARDEGGAGGRRGWWVVGRWHGDSVGQLNSHPRGQANSKWGVLIIKAVYQISNLQTNGTQKLRLRSGVVCIDSSSRMSCAMHFLKRITSMFSTCCAVVKDTGECGDI